MYADGTMARDRGYTMQKAGGCSCRRLQACHSPSCIMHQSSADSGAAHIMVKHDTEWGRRKALVRLHAARNAIMKASVAAFWRGQLPPGEAERWVASALCEYFQL